MKKQKVVLNKVLFCLEREFPFLSKIDWRCTSEAHQLLSINQPNDCNYISLKTSRLCVRQKTTEKRTCSGEDKFLFGHISSSDWSISFLTRSHKSNSFKTEPLNCRDSSISSVSSYKFLIQYNPQWDSERKEQLQVHWPKPVESIELLRGVKKSKGWSCIATEWASAARVDSLSSVILRPLILLFPLLLSFVLLQSSFSVSSEVIMSSIGVSAGPSCNISRIAPILRSPRSSLFSTNWTSCFQYKRNYYIV